MGCLKTPLMWCFVLDFINFEQYKWFWGKFFVPPPTTIVNWALYILKHNYFLQNIPKVWYFTIFFGRERGVNPQTKGVNLVYKMFVPIMEFCIPSTPCPLMYILHVDPLFFPKTWLMIYYSSPIVKVPESGLVGCLSTALM